MCFCGISHSNLINNQLRAESAREAERATALHVQIGVRAFPTRSFSLPFAQTKRAGKTCIIYVYTYIYTYTRACVCGHKLVRARRNIGRPLCDESVLIITLVRGTSRDAFADTYDKLSVYQQISFPNPAIFPLVCPRPSAENNALRSRGTPLAPASCYTLSFPPCTQRVHAAVNTPATVACMQRPAMTAKGRTILLNKVDTANGNVGVRCLLAGINGIAFSFRSPRVLPDRMYSCIRIRYEP